MVQANAVLEVADGVLDLGVAGSILGSNNGNHTALFSDVNTYMSGVDITVPVVDASGYFQDWGTFHVVSAAGGSSKTITGYFKSDFVSQQLRMQGCASGNCPRYLGSYILRLTN